MDSREDFLTIVLPNIEETVISREPSNERRVKRTRIIEDFFIRIGCNAQAPPIPESLDFLDNIRFRMMNPNFSEYLKLVNLKIPPEYIDRYIHNTEFVPKRKEYSLSSNITCAKYIEDVLFDLLDKAQSSTDIDKCVNLLMCPVKVYFQLFLEFTTNLGISREDGIKYFTNFMVLTSAIINKKMEQMEQMERGMDFSMLQEIPGIVIILLASRHIMCNEWLNKINREKSFSGHKLYAILREYFDVTQSLYRRYLAFIQTKIGEVKAKIDTSGINIDHLRGLRELSPEHKDKDKIEDDIRKNQEVIRIQQEILSNLTRMNNELSHLDSIIIDSVRLNGEFSSIGEAVTPARRRGGSKHKHKQVKKKSSKTKKYKKKSSKTKKYKKKYKIY
jgi:hypothetical protein